RGAYRVVGAEVPLVGGCAGDDLRMSGTAQFHDGRVLRRSVVAAAIASDAPLGIGVRHGWRRVGAPMVVTRSEGNRVYALDDASVREATDGACRDALAALDDRPPLGLVAFDCIARRGVLGEPGIHAEVDRIAEFAGGAPVAGFYTYGEIARTQGIGGFHNQTLVVLAVGRAGACVCRGPPSGTPSRSPSSSPPSPPTRTSRPPSTAPSSGPPRPWTRKSP